MINLIAFSDRQQLQSWGEGGISSPTAVYDIYSSLITTSIKMQIYCKMPVVAITPVCLLWPQSPARRTYLAYEAQPLLFQSFISHVWTEKGIDFCRTSVVKNQESIEGIYCTTPGIELISSAHSHSSIVARCANISIE